MIGSVRLGLEKLTHLLERSLEEKPVKCFNIGHQTVIVLLPIF